MRFEAFDKHHGSKETFLHLGVECGFFKLVVLHPTVHPEPKRKN